MTSTSLRKRLQKQGVPKQPRKHRNFLFQWIFPADLPVDLPGVAKEHWYFIPHLPSKAHGAVEHEAPKTHDEHTWVKPVKAITVPS